MQAMSAGREIAGGGGFGPGKAGQNHSHPAGPGKGIAEGDLGKEWGIWTYFVTMDT